MISRGYYGSTRPPILLLTVEIRSAVVHRYAGAAQVNFSDRRMTNHEVNFRPDVEGQFGELLDRFVEQRLNSVNGLDDLSLLSSSAVALSTLQCRMT